MAWMPVSEAVAFSFVLGMAAGLACGWVAARWRAPVADLMIASLENDKRRRVSQGLEEPEAGTSDSERLGEEVPATVSVVAAGFGFGPCVDCGGEAGMSWKSIGPLCGKCGRKRANRAQGSVPALPGSPRAEQEAARLADGWRKCAGCHLLVRPYGGELCADCAEVEPV